MNAWDSFREQIVGCQAEHVGFQSPLSLSLDASEEKIWTLTPWAIFRSWHHFLFLDNIEKIQENLS